MLLHCRHTGWALGQLSRPEKELSEENWNLSTGYESGLQADVSEHGTDDLPLEHTAQMLDPQKQGDTGRRGALKTPANNFPVVSITSQFGTGLFCCWGRRGVSSG